MNHDNRRTTLIIRDPRTPERDWDVSWSSPSRVVILESFTLPSAISAALVDLDLDVERLVLDKSASPVDFLTLLSSLPAQFRGDVLLISDDDSGFLSTTRNGGPRALYAFTTTDVRFYIETNRVVTGRMLIDRIATRIPQQMVVGKFAA